MIRVCAEPCSQCPFKGRLDLRSGRLRDIMSDTHERDAYFACHKTLSESGSADALTGPAAICAGWLEACGDWRPTLLQVAERLGVMNDENYLTMVEVD